MGKTFYCYIGKRSSQWNIIAFIFLRQVQSRSCTFRVYLSAAFVYSVKLARAVELSWSSRAGEGFWVGFSCTWFWDYYCLKSSGERWYSVRGPDYLRRGFKHRITSRLSPPQTILLRLLHCFINFPTPIRQPPALWLSPLMPVLFA